MKCFPIIALLLACAISGFSQDHAFFFDLGQKRIKKREYRKAADNFKAALACSPSYRTELWLKFAQKKAKEKSSPNPKARKIYSKQAKLLLQEISEKFPNDQPLLEIRPICDKKMVYVAGENFMMGSYSEHSAGESPVHEVKVHNFYIDRYEVTNQEFATFLNEYKRHYDDKGYKWINIGDRDCKIYFINGNYFVKKGFETYPVVEVSWKGANAYAQWAGKRLPTEAEWEYAAKGGITQQHSPYAGSKDYKQCAWARDNSGNQLPKPCGKKKANALGIHDMSGNVWEWCADWFSEDYYKENIKIDPLGPDSGQYKVLRGGASNSLSTQLRTAHRNFAPPNETSSHIGFRCAMDAM